MTSAYERRLMLAGTCNVRDLGGYVTSSGITHWRRVLRADGLHRLDLAGIHTLLDLGLTTVIDLRHRREVELAPNPFATHATVQYQNIPLFDEPTPTATESWPGRAMRPLASLYIAAFETRQSAFKAAFGAIADADGVVLFHCTAGKDRTGLIAAILLGLAEVDSASILDDYVLTATFIAPLVDELVVDAQARGVDLIAFRQFLTAEAQDMQSALEHLETCYGGAEGYLRNIGLSDARIMRLKSMLVSGQLGLGERLASP